MNTQRMWTLGSVVLIVALVLGTWAIGVSPRLSEASSAKDSRVSVEAQNAGHEATLASLKKQFEDIEALRQDLAELRVAVPKDAAQSDIVNQINAMAAAKGVAVADLTFEEPSLYVPIENTQEDPELTAALGSVSANNFVVLPLEITVIGPYQNIMAFVNSLQLGDRLVLVHGLNLISGAMASNVESELTVSGQAFALLEAGAAIPEEAAPGVEEEPAGGDVPLE